MAKTAIARAVDLEPIDRLEEKLKMLVGVIDRLRTENSRMLSDNERLVRDLDMLRARVADAEGAGVELNALREERELVRSRVSEMLQQIETLNL